MTTPSRKRNNDNDSETPGILSRLFSSKKKPRVEERSDRVHRLPSPVIPSPPTNRLTATAEIKTTTMTSSTNIASPVFHLGVSDRMLPSQARRSKTYFKPSSRTLLIRKNPRISKSNNNTINNSKTIATMMQNSKGTLFPTITDAPTPLYRSLPGQRILGSHQTQSRLTHFEGSPKPNTQLTTTTTSTPAPMRKSVKFDAEVSSFLTPAVPKVRIQRLQTPAPTMSPKPVEPSETPPSTADKTLVTPDGPFIFASGKTVPTTAPTTIPTYPTILCTWTYSCRGVPAPNIDLSACYDPQPLITLQPRDCNKVTVHAVRYSIDEEEYEMEQKKPRTDSVVPPPIPLSWAGLPAIAALYKGKWKCATCSVYVDDSQTTCVACQAVKPGTQEIEPPKVTTGVGVFSGSGFTFGTSVIPTIPVVTGGPFQPGAVPVVTGAPFQPGAVPVVTGGFIFSAAKSVETTKRNEQMTPPKFPMATTIIVPQTEPRKKRALIQEDNAPKTESKKPAFGIDQFKAPAKDHAMPTMVFGKEATQPPVQKTTPKHPGPYDNESTNPSAPPPSGFLFGTTTPAATSVAPPFSITSIKQAAAPATDTPQFAFGSSAPIAAPATDAPQFAFGSSAPIAAPATDTPKFAFGSSAPIAAPATDAPKFAFGSSALIAAPATDVPTSSAPSISFGVSTPATAPATNAPLFTFGSSTPAAPAPVSDAPFSFGSSTPAATPATKAPLFSFGSSTSAAPAPASDAPFSFGSSTQAAASAPASDAPFSFGSSTSAAPVAPLFSFGSSTPAAPNLAGDVSFSFGSSTPAVPAPAGFSFGNAPQPAPAFSAPAPTSTTSFPFGTTATAHVSFGGTPAVSFGSQNPLSAPSPVPTFTAPSYGVTPGFGFASTPAGFLGSGSAHVAAAPDNPAFGFGVVAPTGLPGGFGGMSQPTTPAAPASYGTPHVATPQVGGFSIGTGGANKGTVGRRRAIKAKRPPSSGRML